MANCNDTNDLWFQGTGTLLMPMKATNNPNIMTLSQTMHTEDKEEIRER